MQLDTLTILAVMTVIQALASAVLFLISRMHPDVPGARAWGLANLFAALANISLVTRDSAPALIAILLGNAAYTLASVFFMDGIRRFCGRPTARKLDAGLALLVLGALVGFTYLHPSLHARIAVMSAFFARFGLISCWMLITSAPPRARVLYNSIAAPFGLFGAVMVVRTTAFLFFPVDGSLSAPNSTLRTVVLLTGVMISAVWMLGFVLLIMQRVADELSAARDELHRIAHTDALTGVHNRRSFFQRAEAEHERAQRHGRPLSLVCIDLDHFKRINDEYGHPVGDVVLLGVAERLQETLRISDVLGRLGGEEFAVLLPETQAHGAEILAGRLRECIARAPFTTPRGALTLTASFGIATAHPEEEFASLLARADDALYHSKHRGRNRVTSASGSLPAVQPRA